MRPSIATKLFRRVFVYYLLIAVAVTSGVILQKYLTSKDDLTRELGIHERTFSEPLASALWALDIRELTLIANGMLEVPEITGVKISSHKGKRIFVAAGTIGLDLREQSATGPLPETTKVASLGPATDLIAHQFPVTYHHATGTEPVGFVTVYTSRGIIIDRIKYPVLVILLAAAVKTAALWLIFIAVSRAMLSRPLNRLTTFTDTLQLADLRNMDGRPAEIAADEIGSLEGSIGGMVERLAAAKAALDTERDQLEATVAERTEMMRAEITHRQEFEDRLRARERQQKVVADLGQMALTAPPLTVFINDVVARVAETLEVEMVSVLELKADGGHFIVRSGIGWAPGIVGDITIPADASTLAGYTLISHEPVICTDLKTETRFGMSEVLADHGVVSAMTVIIGDISHPFGALGVYTTSPRAFTPDDINFIQGVANILALSVDLAAKVVALNDAKSHAEMANRSKSEFLAAMSHDLRTPLNAILGYSQVLRGDANVDLTLSKRTEYANDIHASGHHLLLLVNDILDLSKIEAGEMAVDHGQIDIHEVVDGCLRMVEDGAAEKRITLESTVPDQLPLLDADKTRVTQVVLNLLSNAVKFTPDGGRVSVTAAHRETGGLSVTVRDTGIGIAADDIPLALSPFGQVQHSSVSRDGTGLGLPLAKRLMELHGGDLRLDSTPGAGTAATITFPISRVIKTDQYSARH